MMGPRSSRGAWSNPGAEHQIKLAELRERSSGSIPVAAPVSGSVPVVSASGDTVKGNKPEMNFDDAQGDTEGDVDDGDKKRRGRASRPETGPERQPDLSDETTVVAGVGYPGKVLAEADRDRVGPDSLQPETIAEPATARKAGAMTK